MTTVSRWALVASLATFAMGGCGGSTFGGGTGGGAGGRTTGSGGQYFVTGGFTAMGGFTGTGGGPGTGGIPGTGGDFPATGGAVGWGGYFGAGGFFGAGGNFGAGGFFGTGGHVGGTFFPDAGTCSTQDIGPLSTSDATRPFGWTFSGPSGADGGAPVPIFADGGAPAPSSADGGPGPARCQSVPAAYPGTSCVGLASLQATADGPVIVFADASRLQWNGTLPATMKPFVVNAAQGDSVWVDYQKRNVVVCPFCGAYTNNTLQVRDAEAGRIRFYAQQGAVLPNLTNAQVKELFGVAAAPLQTCTFPAHAGCYTYLRSQFDHQLATMPPQLIVDATLTTVTAPNGRFAVIWASSQESYVEQQPNCSDGPGVASDTGFVATLLAP